MKINEEERKKSAKRLAELDAERKRAARDNEEERKKTAKKMAELESRRCIVSWILEFFNHDN